MPLYVLLFKQSIIHKGINKTKAQPEGTQETICNRDFRRHNLIRAQNNRKMLKPSPQFRQANPIAVSSNITFLKKLFCIGNDRHTSVQSANVDKYEMCVRDFFGGLYFVCFSLQFLLAFILKFCCMVLSWLCSLNQSWLIHMTIWIIASRVFILIFCFFVNPFKSKHEMLAKSWKILNLYFFQNISIFHFC